MMNKFVSLILILALSFQCLVKLGLITYYSINITYIVKELCENKDKPELKCNGKCFLKKKMGLADKAEKQSAEIFKQIEFPVFIPHESPSLNTGYINIENSSFELPNLYSHTAYDNIFHPPLV